jgi:hypothetical protein
MPPLLLLPIMASQTASCTDDDGVCLRIGCDAILDELDVDSDVHPPTDAANDGIPVIIILHAAHEQGEQGELGNTTKLPADGDEQYTMKLPAGSGTTVATPGGESCYSWLQQDVTC